MEQMSDDDDVMGFGDTGGMTMLLIGSHLLFFTSLITRLSRAVNGARDTRAKDYFLQYRYCQSPMSDDE